MDFHPIVLKVDLEIVLVFFLHFISHLLATPQRYFHAGCGYHPGNAHSSQKASRYRKCHVTLASGFLQRRDECLKSHREIHLNKNPLMLG